MFYQLSATAAAFIRSGHWSWKPAICSACIAASASPASPIFCSSIRKSFRLAGYEIASRRPIGEIRISHRLFEDPTRIAGVRAYQSGDPLNRIHWRATARTGATPQQDLRALDDCRHHDRARLSHRLARRQGRALPFGAGDHGRRFAGQCGLRNGAAGRPGQQLPRRRRSHPQRRLGRRPRAAARPPSGLPACRSKATDCGRSWSKRAAGPSSF